MGLGFPLTGSRPGDRTYHGIRIASPKYRRRTDSGADAFGRVCARRFGRRQETGTGNIESASVVVCKVDGPRPTMTVVDQRKKNGDA